MISMVSNPETATFKTKCKSNLHHQGESSGSKLSNVETKEVEAKSLLTSLKKNSPLIYIVLNFNYFHLIPQSPPRTLNHSFKLNIKNLAKRLGKKVVRGKGGK